MDKEKIKILYVDDVQNNLNVFRATFRNDYKIFLAASAQEGMEILKDQEVSVIIADQRMPGMTGVEFFEMILKKYPNPVRILLTGYTDLGSVIDAINKGQVYRYIPKPWYEPDLRLAIENAFEIYDVRQKLEKTNLELIKRNDELNRFVYSASHEMKAPLRTISGILNMAAQNKEIDPSQYFSMIQKCTNNLDSFIKNVVDYYRNQRYNEYVKEISFEKIIKELIENYMFYENVTDINFKIFINEKIPFVNDEFRARVIINNILSNSIKYQKKEYADKQVEVKIDTNDFFVTMIFRDNGIGISQQYLDSIFKMFFRATEHGTGSGIGLYIVKEAVDKLQGEIKVESVEGEGTLFTIKIPNKFNIPH
ncbi:MAG: hybrid sensor histidine kinase/response regulator [Cytophagaceae bacterium]|nr:hybrid sensor histidine kinase/response regulator [Cytophagaceae bacterium]